MYTRVRRVYTRVCARSFSDYAMKNLAGDYNVICGRRRHDATRRAVTPLPPRFPHVNNS